MASDAWIRKFKTLDVKLQHAICKRVLFFRLPDTPLVRAEQRKRRQDDVTAMVAAGLERERKFLRACGKEDASTATTPSEVDNDMLSSSDDVEFDSVCRVCEEPCQEVRGGVCAECLRCPPSSR